jgi:hypothetical protein
VVDFEDSIVERKMLDARFEFVVEYPTRRVKVFVVDAHREHEVAEFAVGDSFTPRHFGTCLERGLYVFEEEIAIVACYIAERHIGVEESESIALVGGKLLIENGVEILVVERCTTSGKVVAYFVREG